VRVLELEINNVRGISHLLLKPDGKNFVVWGPNGSGKSAVVDAIDFLLTGRVSRLTGKGTRGITLTRHGPHIDHEPKEAIVRAIVQLPGVTKPIEIKRCMANPNNLECDKSMESHLEAIMTIAHRGQHVLSRREILKYITAEAGTRAQEIQELLNIIEIEDTRKALVKVQNNLDTDLQAANTSVSVARGAVNATVQMQTYREEIVMQVVNQNRRILGGKPISALHSSDLKIGLKPPTVAVGSQAIKVTLLDRDIQNLVNVTLADNKALIAKNDEQLRALIATIRYDPQLLHALSHLQLTKLGIGLIDETGNCPLCGTPWPQGKLKEQLEQQLSVAEVAAQHQERISELSTIILDSVNTTIASVQKVIVATKIAGLKDELQRLQSWLSNLQDLSIVLSAAIEKYPDSRFDMSQIQQMLAPADVTNTLSLIHSAIKTKSPEITPEQTAWDTLTRLEENLKALESAEKNFKIAELFQQRASILLESFLKARDNVLGKLYEDIKDRFVGLYRQLHGLDEAKFMAKIEPEGAGLNFEVDFYGRGTHPPHALHSEGHQDSMGICLYLALAERLTGGLIDLVILDDVVMSVDADHRRQVCHLFATSFPHRQFLITTHDRTWASQLKSEGVVGSNGLVEFYNWNIETGPEVQTEVDIWEKIEADLQRNDIPSAAARLRRGSEQFFGMVCDALQASVLYKLNGRLELGDFLLPAMDKYRDLIKKAQRAAKSWDDSESRINLEEKDDIRSQIYKRTFAEQWAVNVNVHYNNWANFSIKDFRPVVEAFQDLYSLFICSNCGGMLSLATTGTLPVSVRCNCGKVNWNLTEKVGTN
jgi:recombinational DNA repair ATPase RecF